MFEFNPPFRRAVPSDACALAELVNDAGEGVPLHVWNGLAGPGQTGWDIGRMRSAQGLGCFSYRNSIMIDHEGEPAGCLVGEPLPLEPAAIDDDTPAVIRPLHELQNLDREIWYVSALAVLPQFRRKGLGTALLGLADRLGDTAGRPCMGVITADTNTAARRLYEHCGYRMKAVRPMVKNGWAHQGENWVLMTKTL
ncbi:MAG: GNAT family N-acetyltransferase [Pseudomonadota bacterium]